MGTKIKKIEPFHAGYQLCDLVIKWQLSIIRQIIIYYMRLLSQIIINQLLFLKKLIIILMKQIIKQDKITKPTSILKKSQSHKAILNHIFDNQNLKQAVKPEKTESVYSSLQQTLKQQIKKLKKKEGAPLPKTQSFKELGHKLIHQIKELSDDNVLLTKIVVEFMESMSSRHSEDIIRHFKNTLNLIVRGIRNRNKDNQKSPKQSLKQTKSKIQTKNSVKELVIHTQNLQDSLLDCRNELKLYKQLLNQQRQLCRTYQSKITKFEKFNNMMTKNQQSYQLQIGQLKNLGQNLQEQLRRKDSQYKRQKDQLNILNEKLHCVNIQNQSLQNTNKAIQKQLNDARKQINLSKNTKDNRLQILQKNNKDLNQKFEVLMIENDNLKSTINELNSELKKIYSENQQTQQDLQILEQKLKQSSSQIIELQKQIKIGTKRQKQMDVKIQVLEFQKLRLEAKMKVVESESHDQPKIPQKQTPAPFPPRSNKKLKALQDIQALIRKHKTYQ